jgi:hypothetical protein
MPKLLATFLSADAWLTATFDPVYSHVNYSTLATFKPVTYTVDYTQAKRFDWFSTREGSSRSSNGLTVERDRRGPTSPDSFNCCKSSLWATPLHRRAAAGVAVSTLVVCRVQAARFNVQTRKGQTPAPAPHVNGSSARSWPWVTLVRWRLVENNFSVKLKGAPLASRRPLVEGVSDDWPPHQGVPSDALWAPSIPTL